MVKSILWLMTLSSNVILDWMHTMPTNFNLIGYLQKLLSNIKISLPKLSLCLNRSLLKITYILNHYRFYMRLLKYEAFFQRYFGWWFLQIKTDLVFFFVCRSGVLLCCHLTWVAKLHTKSTKERPEIQFLRTTEKFETYPLSPRSHLGSWRSCSSLCFRADSLNILESWVPPGQRATMFINLPSIEQTAYIS